MAGWVVSHVGPQGFRRISAEDVCMPIVDLVVKKYQKYKKAPARRNQRAERRLTNNTNPRRQPAGAALWDCCGKARKRKRNGDEGAGRSENEQPAGAFVWCPRKEILLVLTTDEQ